MGGTISGYFLFDSRRETILCIISVLLRYRRVLRTSLRRIIPAAVVVVAFQQMETVLQDRRVVDLDGTL